MTQNTKLSGTCRCIPLIRLAELVFFIRRINGVAMGTKMGPSYANPFVGYIEHQLFNQYNSPKPELYRRYIDTALTTVSAPPTLPTREDLNQFIAAVNSFHPALKYTWESSDTALAFLDIKVSIEGNGLCTSVHYKPTDSVFIFTSITCQEFHSLFSVSQTSPSL